MDCPLCGGGEETVQHFVIECGELREIRERYGVCGAEALEEVLLFGGRSGEKVGQCKKMLEEMWKLRRRRIEPVQQQETSEGMGRCR